MITIIINSGLKFYYKGKININIEYPFLYIDAISHDIYEDNLYT